MAADAEPDRVGSLTIVGTGIRPGLQTTPEARSRIAAADKVLYVLAEHGPTAWLHALNASAESTMSMYRLGRPFREVYEETVATLLGYLEQGLDVCAVSYGHPGVLDWPSAELTRRARERGYATTILPAVSAQDCLFVDLGLDPGVDGYQTFDATDFLVRGRRPDPTVPLVLWQISVIGIAVVTDEVHRAGLEILAERLTELYGPNHEVVVYEASPFPVGESTIERCPVRDLARAGVSGMSSLYVPPASTAPRDPSMLARLDLPTD